MFLYEKSHLDTQRLKVVGGDNNNQDDVGQNP